MLINEFKHVYRMDFDCACSLFLGWWANESNIKLKSSLLLLLFPYWAFCCATAPSCTGTLLGKSHNKMENLSLIFKPSMLGQEAPSDCSPGIHSILLMDTNAQGSLSQPAIREKKQSFSLSPVQSFTLLQFLHTSHCLLQ